MRTYGAEDLVVLPRLNVSSALALGQGLLRVAKTGSALPSLIAARLLALEAAYSELHQALGQQKHNGLDSKRTLVADLTAVQAWSALHDWLVGWTKLRGPHAESARTIYAALFLSRLKFTQGPFQLEWAEADVRLTRIAQDRFNVEIEKLGGKPILDQLREAHRAYGEALGITVAGDGGLRSGLREPLIAFLGRMRAYVLAVAAHADEAEPETVALSDALLAPLPQWHGWEAEPASDEPVATPSAPQVSRITTRPGPVRQSFG